MHITRAFHKEKITTQRIKETQNLISKYLTIRRTIKQEELHKTNFGK